MPLGIRTLERSDVREGFSCGEPSLDTFLVRYAWQNQQRHHLGVTYVAVDDASRRVVGYFTVAMAAIAPESSAAAAPGRYASVPALRITRLAVDRHVQGAGVGSELVYAALRIALGESERVGCAGVLVDALPDSVGFCERYGFERLRVVVGSSAVRPCPVPMYLSLGAVRRAMEQSSEE